MQDIASEIMLKKVQEEKMKTQPEQGSKLRLQFQVICSVWCDLPGIGILTWKLM